MGVSSIDAANAVLPQFAAAWNEKFAVDPRDDADAHRPWADTPDALTIHWRGATSGDCRRR